MIQSVDDISGVFEFSWFPDSNILVTALAEGPPKLLKYEEKRLQLIATECQEKDLEMTLAVAGDSECFVSCDNKGYLRQWNLNGSEMVMERCWNAHDAEIWYVSRDLRDKNLFFTGSDDYCLKIWDIRCDSSQLVASNKTGHEAGVCCIAASPWDEYVIASGSYDENVRLWDRRFMKDEPIKTVECGSGAWRVVWNPVERNVMVVAAMRAGFHVLDLDKNEIIRTETVSDHVAYGIDWHPNGSSLVSCSFYNNQGQFFSTK